VYPDETLALDAGLGWGVNASTKFGGTAPLKIWEGKKRPKFSTFYDNFRVWPRISLKPMKIVTKSKRRWWEGFFGHWTKKILWNSVHYEQSYKRSFWPTLSRVFPKTIFWPLGGAALPNFYTRYKKWPSLTRSPPIEDGGLPYNFFERKVKNWLKM